MLGIKISIFLKFVSMIEKKFTEIKSDIHAQRLKIII